MEASQEQGIRGRVQRWLWVTPLGYGSETYGHRRLFPASYTLMYSPSPVASSCGHVGFSHWNSV